MNIKPLRTRIGDVWMGEDGIGRSVLFPDTVISLDDVKEFFAAAAKASGGRKVPSLVDARKIRSVERKAQRYLDSPEVTELTAAAAIIVGLTTSAIFGNLLVNINKPAYPVRLFTSEKKALEWLKQYVPKKGGSNEP